VLAEKEKIIKLIDSNDFARAEKLIKSQITSKNMGNETNLEFFYVCLMALNKHHDLLKHLKLDKVPPRPIDTRFDIGRRFFYTLHVTNQRGGHKLVKQYLDNIKVHRTMEFRFVGGIHFDLLEFSRALDYYKTAFEKMQHETFNEKFHLPICGNLLFSCLYAGRYEEIESYKNLITNFFGKNVENIHTNIDCLVAVKNKDINVIKNGLKTNFISDTQRSFLECCVAYLSGKTQEFEDHLKVYEKIKRKLVNAGIENPRRYFSGLFYLKSLINASDSDFLSVIDFKNFSFPFNAKFFGEFDIPNNYQFQSMGNKSAKNYINLVTEEWLINGERGIGLSAEIKALAALIRSGDFGMSFEYLTGEVYENIGYSEMFLIRGRIKQLLNRIKIKFNITPKTKKFIASLDLSTILDFRIDLKKELKMKKEVNIKNLCEFYSITTNTARKHMKRLEGKL
tara:strand:- start:1292 stop:2647 length:1356 start_codon:yes stop_codon:yes gene_type:complete